MTVLHASVGEGGANRFDDVSAVQIRLQVHARWLDGSIPQVTGHCDPVTSLAIRAFQANAAALLHPDGLVSPHGFTWTWLNRALILPPLSPVFSPVCWYHSRDGLPDASYVSAAQALRCEVDAIKAVAATETKRAAWDSVGRPAILFERHYFSRLTHHVFDRSHPDIGNRVAGGYGRFSAQYPKLGRAAMLNELAALQSASWGMFQIMGVHFRLCGFASVEDFVTAMLDSETKHLAAFVAFISGHPAMLRALRGKDWTTFARLYNGPNYAENDYDTNIRDAYDQLHAMPVAR